MSTRVKQTDSPWPLGLWLALTAVVVVGVFTMTAEAQWRVVNLHPGDSFYSSWGLGVQGGQQVGYTRPVGGSRASLWTGSANPWVNLHPAPAGPTDYSHAYGVYGGQQVGLTAIRPPPPPYLPHYKRASLWTGSAGSWVNLHPGEWDAHSVALGVYGDPKSGYQQVGEAEVLLGNYFYWHASLWTGSAASWVDLNPNGAESSCANAVYAGQQAGEAYVDGVRQAGLWSGTARSWVSLHPAGASASSAHGVYEGQQSGDAWVVVDGVERECASLWKGTPSSWRNLIPSKDGVKAAASVAWAVCNGVQVGAAEWDGQSRASLWSGTAESWVDLHAFLPPEFTSSSAKCIWRDGVSTYVVGWGLNSTSRRTEALMWVGVLRKGEISVTPADAFISAGPQGGPFVPPNKVYRITNIGQTAVNYTADDNVAWITTSPTGGALDAGQFVDVTVATNAATNALAPGVYNATLTVTNTTNGLGNTTRPIQLTVLRKGDLNCDGVVNNFDIDPFVLALTDPAGYSQRFPNCDRMLADINGDGVVNNFDIDPFVRLLSP